MWEGSHASKQFLPESYMYIPAKHFIYDQLICPQRAPTQNIHCQLANISAYICNIFKYSRYGRYGTIPYTMDLYCKCKHLLCTVTLYNTYRNIAGAHLKVQTHKIFNFRIFFRKQLLLVLFDFVCISVVTFQFQQKPLYPLYKNLV